MSRLGKTPIEIAKGVDVKLDVAGVVSAKGPLGLQSLNVPTGIGARIEEGKLIVDVDKTAKLSPGAHGLYWALIKNLITGVSKGFEVRLALIGVGYRAEAKGNNLELQVGYSFPIPVAIPAGVKVLVEKGTEIIITGMDKREIGQFAATVRSKRPPEPYKGKGIRYKDERVRKKAGKSATKGK